VLVVVAFALGPPSSRHEVGVQSLEQRLQSRQVRLSGGYLETSRRCFERLVQRSGG